MPQQVIRINNDDLCRGLANFSGVDQLTIKCLKIMTNHLLCTIKEIIIIRDKMVRVIFIFTMLFVSVVGDSDTSKDNKKAHNTIASQVIERCHVYKLPMIENYCVNKHSKLLCEDQCKGSDNKKCKQQCQASVEQQYAHIKSRK